MPETGDDIAEPITPAMNKSILYRTTGISVNMYRVIRRSIATGKEMTYMSTTFATTIAMKIKNINKFN
jgi:hypothetical protein